MLRSMYSGVSGLRNHQVRMDVIGNNIANVNTVAFKSSRVVFKDLYSQTVKSASAPVAAGLGGTNPQQVGLGVSVSAIDVLHTRGGNMYTGRPLDMCVDGEGFFVVSDGLKNYFTRDGNFKLDDLGNLLTADGLHVQGTPFGGGPMANITINPAYRDVSVDKNGVVTAIDPGPPTATVTIGTINIATFSNQEALEKVGGNLYSNSQNSGAPVYVTPGTAGYAYLSPGSLEMSNVDLAQEFTDMIVTQRGFQANSRIITTSDQMLEELVNLKR